jgi:DNA end-binding protein Ku
MARSIWTGSISFGLVNVPVKLYSATQSKDVRFNEFRAGTTERIRHKRVGEQSGEEVPYSDIVKGYEVADGQFVTLGADELEAVEPGRSRTIDIEDFVALDEVDPTYFDRTYYLGPTKDAGADKPYELLRRVLADTGRVGIARFVMRTKQYLALIRPAEGILMLETLFFADEVRSPSETIEVQPEGVRIKAKELEIAGQLIESLTTKWKPEQYQDTYRERVLGLIEQKAAGEELVVEPRPEAEKVVDLMAALEASVARARDEGRRPRKRAARKRTPRKARSKAS